MRRLALKRLSSCFSLHHPMVSIMSDSDNSTGTGEIERRRDEENGCRADPTRRPLGKPGWCGV